MAALARAMLALSLIGIGCGDPEQLTRAAVRAINAADLILIPREGRRSPISQISGGRSARMSSPIRTTRIAEFDLPVRDAGEADYHKGVDDWHDAVAAAWSRTIASHLEGDGKVALLIWGDPSLYDSSLRIARRLDPLPGYRGRARHHSIQALCAAHALPLNDIGEPFLVTTGRRLREGGWPQGVDTVVVMLDGGTAFQSLDPAGLHIWWGRLSRHARPDRRCRAFWPRSARASPRDRMRASGTDGSWTAHSQAQAVSEAACSPNGSPGNAPMSPLSTARRRSRVRRNSQNRPARSAGWSSLRSSLRACRRPSSLRAARVPIIVFAGDHGIVAQGVSAYPQGVTIAMMANVASGGAAISVLARELGSNLEVVDAGTLAQEEMAESSPTSRASGTRDFSVEAALTPTELAFAFEAGQRAVARAEAGRPDLLIFGEMGIGNTTTSAAIAASLLGISAEEIASSGTGVDAAGRAHKAGVIDAAIAHHSVAGASPERILCAVGGLEIAAICGAIIAAAQAPRSRVDRWLHRIGGSAGSGAAEPVVPAISCCRRINRRSRGIGWCCVR